MITPLWHWRHLVVAFARREFRARYAGSVLGAAWAFLEPAVQFGLYLLVFSYFLGMRLEGRGSVGSFGFYLVGGMIPYLAIQESLVRAAGLARANAPVVRHVSVPLEALLAGTLLSVFVRHALAFALVLAVAAVSGALVLAQLPWLAVGVVVLVVGTYGLALLLVPAGAFLPDLVQVVTTVTTVLFFVTPIVYPPSALPAAARPWVLANPLVALLDTFRAGLVGLPVDPRRVAVAAGTAVLLTVAGAAVFGRRASAARDIV